MTHFTVGIERAGCVRGEGPLHTAENMCEKGVILMDGWAR
jgi:hypothetical protein